MSDPHAAVLKCKVQYFIKTFACSLVNGITFFRTYPLKTDDTMSRSGMPDWARAGVCPASNRASHAARPTPNTIISFVVACASGIQGARNTQPRRLRLQADNELHQHPAKRYHNAHNGECRYPRQELAAPLDDVVHLVALSGVAGVTAKTGFA